MKDKKHFGRRRKGERSEAFSSSKKMSGWGRYPKGQVRGVFIHFLGGSVGVIRFGWFRHYLDNFICRKRWAGLEFDWNDTNGPSGGPKWPTSGFLGIFWGFSLIKRKLLELQTWMLDHFWSNFHFWASGTIIFGLKVIWRSFKVISRSFEGHLMGNLSFFTPLYHIYGLTYL